MKFLALLYTYTCTCTEFDAHALIQKLINLVCQFNKHLIITCFRFDYCCPNIVKIYILSGFLQIFIILLSFVFKALFKVVLYIVEGLIVQIMVGYTTVSITLPEITESSLTLLLLLYCICYSCQIYQSGTDYVYVQGRVSVFTDC